MAVRGLTFDFWGTLFTEGPKFLEVVLPKRYEILLDATSEAGVPADEEAVREAYRAASAAFRASWEAGEHMSNFDRVAYIFKTLGVPYDEGLVALTARKLEDAALEGDLVPLPGTLEAIPALAENYPLGIVSDTGLTPGRVLRELLARQNFARYFYAMSFSDETGAVKPSPEAFHHALSKMGVEPKAALHTGDLPRADVEGAFAAGYAYAVLYTGRTARDPRGIQPTAILNDHRELVKLLPRLR
ncbi:MAG TPA: HAD family hydrolase [Oceanithermus sp.]|nr:HAD family hydrolase [Oceanithermus sp.]